MTKQRQQTPQQPAQAQPAQPAPQQHFETPGELFLALVHGDELSQCEAIRRTALAFPNVSHGDFVADLVAAGVNEHTARTQFAKARYSHSNGAKPR